MRRVLSALAVVALLSPAAFAAPLDVVINEVAWSGSATDSGDEWIELYNNTASPIDLTGWTIEDDGSTVYPLLGTIPANGYYLIEQVEEATDVPSDLVPAGPAMNMGNTGDTLVLLDASAAVVDTVDCGTGWYAGTNPPIGTADASMERRNPDWPGDLMPNWGDNDGVTVNGLDSGGVALSGTPKAQNSIFGTLDTRPNIVHIESTASATQLRVYFDQDVTAATAEVAANYAIDGVPPGAAQVYNGLPDAILLDGIANVVDEGGPYTLTVVGVENAGGDASDASAEFIGGLATIAFIRDDSDASTVPDLLELYPDVFFTVSAEVSAVGTFTYQESYVQDFSGGIAVFDANTTALLTRWDHVRVSGKLDQYNGKDEIVETMVEIFPGTPIAPIVVTEADLLLGEAELLEGMLVAIVQVSDTGGADTWPADGSSANIEITDDASVSLFTMRIDSDTDIDGSPMPAWPADVQGIISQFDSSAPYDSGYQILPRDLADINPGGGFCNTLGATQPCYSGPAGTDVNLPCQGGIQTCDGTNWGPCVGEVLPLASDDTTCDGVDDDCDGMIDDDVDTQTDPLNCGACGNDCTVLYPNADGTCNAGMCEMGACDAGFFDCDTSLDSCETALGTDTDCAACGNDCTAYLNAAGSTCDTSGTPVCSLLCDTDFDDCDGSLDSCEVALGTTTDCASCGDACGTNEACQASVCGCDTGFDDCDGLPATGCETPLGTDTDCSACNDACDAAFPNATGSCTAGACVMGLCDTDYGDCDTSLDSCETSLTTTSDCGSCGNTCGAGEGCLDTGGGVWDCVAGCADADGDGAADDTCGGSDCDDTNPDINPSATEVCDDVDNNCDTVIDEGFDVDGDTYKSCGAEADCDDGNPAINPAATEVCDGADNNCDSAIDEGFDVDGDGYTTCATPAPDCDDADPAVNPGEAEICDDVDNNCDTVVDEGFDDKGTSCDGPDADTCDNGTFECNAAGDALECVGDTPAVEACDGLDNDCDTEVDEDWPTLGDACDGTDSDECANGQLVCNSAGNGVECNENPTQNQEELCNGTDDDCDGEVDEGFETYTCGVGACQVTVEVCLDGEYQSCVPLDAPEAVEISCEDGLDNDCDGYADDEDLDCTGGGGGGGGCDCSVSAGRTTGGFALLLFGLVAALRRRRR